MVDFGWSAETVVLIVKAAKKIHIAFKNGPREGKELLDDFGIFYEGLEKLDSLLKLYRCDVNVGCATWQRTIDKCEEFQRKLEQITNESKGIGQQFQKLWATTKHAFSKDISILRQEINTSSQLLAFQCQFVTLRISLEESEANRRSRAEIEETYRRHTPSLRRETVTLGLDTNQYDAILEYGEPPHRHATSFRPDLSTPELDAYQQEPRRPSTIPELGTVSAAEEPRTPIVLDSFPTTYHRALRVDRMERNAAPIEQTRTMRNDLQRMRHELEAYNSRLRRQEIELEGSIPQTTIHELSESNYDIDDPVAQEEPAQRSDSPIERHTGVTAEQIALTRSEIHDILERVSNIQKRSDSWADSGYGTMESASDFALSPRSPFAHDARRRDTLVSATSLQYGSPLSTSPQLGPNERPDFSNDIPFADFSVGSPDRSERISASTSPGSPRVAPTVNEGMASPLLSPNEAQTPARALSIRSNSDASHATTTAATELCNNCVLQLTDTNPTRNAGGTLTARQYPFEECSMCRGDCETVLRYFRRPTSRGITLLISCKNSGKEIQHELSSNTWVVPHIRYQLPEASYQVQFREDKMTNGFRGIHLDRHKFKPTYKFANATDFRSFQELIFDKDLVEIFSLKSNASSAARGSCSETLRVWRDRTSNELSILIHGALFENRKLQHYERSKSGFKPLQKSDVKTKLRLYLSDTPQITLVERRESFASDASATSSRSSSGRVKLLSYIDLEFHKEGDVRRFVRIWEPSILSTL